MTELYDTICRIVEEKRAARRHPTIALSLEISQRTGWPVFIIEWEMRELERADGQRIFLRGFGVFQPKERKAKVGRNITRGEQLSIPPKRVPQFRPYPHFKKVVEKGK